MFVNSYESLAAPGSGDLSPFYAEQVFQLNCYVNEALLFEQIVENKLESLKDLLQETQVVSENGWQAMLNEEKLLEKLSLYEEQLQLMKKVLEEKFQIERAGKALLDRILNEKSEALRKALEYERCLGDAERECTHWRTECESAQEAYQSVSVNLQTKTKELEKLEQKFHEADGEKTALRARLAATLQESEAAKNGQDQLRNELAQLQAHIEQRDSSMLTHLNLNKMLSEASNNTTPDI
ncbi:unnamed protein product [Protopolystoma xenopodis]|uniref:Uncharacterized protein n=1 Tax=Protopolystoma xenopodis TaxID=117903 RepID=A0A3S5AVS2_9PLAT|nr:unnamed protein product [Protopolystoma xenopodis]